AAERRTAGRCVWGARLLLRVVDLPSGPAMRTSQPCVGTTTRVRAARRSELAAKQALRAGARTRRQVYRFAAVAGGVGRPASRLRECGGAYAGHSIASPTLASFSHVSSRTEKPHSRRTCPTT